MSLVLYDYIRSSAAYRVRIALNLKGLSHRLEDVNLLDGAQKQAPYTELNPQALVPALGTDTDHILTQSVAILEWLEEQYPEPALLPSDAPARAQVRAWVLSIACDIHPLNNLRVLAYLQTELGVSDAQKSAWYQHWIHQGFAALEAQLSQGDGPFCLGPQVSLADVCLIPQMFNAKRFAVDLSAYPRLCAIDQHCATIPAFRDASPAHHPRA